MISGLVVASGLVWLTLLESPSQFCLISPNNDESTSNLNFVDDDDDEWRDYKEVFGQWSTMRQKSWQYLAGMASSMATIVSIGTLSALYVWAHHGTILSETSSLIETVLRKYVLSRWHLLMTMEVGLSKVRLCDIGVECKLLVILFCPFKFWWQTSELPL